MSNHYFFSDDTLMFYHNRVLLTDKLNLNCSVLHETKESLTITKIYITIFNILMFTIIIALVIIIIIIIIITITGITITTTIVFVKSALQIC